MNKNHNIKENKEYINFLLGKTIDDSIILVNECEQYTKANLRLILTRLGEHSKIVLTGDSKQVNRKSIVNKTVMEYLKSQYIYV